MYYRYQKLLALIALFGLFTWLLATATGIFGWIAFLLVIVIFQLSNIEEMLDKISENVKK